MPTIRQSFCSPQVDEDGKVVLICASEIIGILKFIQPSWFSDAYTIKHSYFVKEKLTNLKVVYLNFEYLGRIICTF